MNINIYYKNGEYHWTLYDGPDGIDKSNGVCYSLGEVFEKIVQERLLISKEY